MPKGVHRKTQLHEINGLSELQDVKYATQETNSTW